MDKNGEGGNAIAVCVAVRRLSPFLFIVFVCRACVEAPFFLSRLGKLKRGPTLIRCLCRSVTCACDVFLFIMFVWLCECVAA